MLLTMVLVKKKSSLNFFIINNTSINNVIFDTFPIKIVIISYTKIIDFHDSKKKKKDSLIIKQKKNYKL